MPGDRRDAGSDKEIYCFELAQFVHRRIDLLGIRSLRVQDGFGVVEDDEHLLEGKEGSQGCQVLWVFNTRTNDLEESGKEMSTRRWKLITTDESSVLAKSLF